MKLISFIASLSVLLVVNAAVIDVEVRVADSSSLFKTTDDDRCEHPGRLCCPEQKNPWDQKLPYCQNSDNKPGKCCVGSCWTLPNRQIAICRLGDGDDEETLKFTTKKEITSHRKGSEKAKHQAPLPKGSLDGQAQCTEMHRFCCMKKPDDDDYRSPPLPPYCNDDYPDKPEACCDGLQCEQSPHRIWPPMAWCVPKRGDDDL